MAKKFLNGSFIISVSEQVSSKRMAESMATGRFIYPGFSNSHFYLFLY